MNYAMTDNKLFLRNEIENGRNVFINLNTHIMLKLPLIFIFISDLFPRCILFPQKDITTTK